MKVFTILRVSSEDQKRGYGLDVQWEEDVVPSAADFDIEISPDLCRSITESATGWERPMFKAAVEEAIDLFRKDEIGGIIFPRVDRETRFVLSSMPLLSSILREGMRVYFAREQFELDPNDAEAVNRYLEKVKESQAYIDTLRRNTTRGRRRRIKAGKLANGKASYLYGYDYVKGREEGQGIRRVNEAQAAVVRDIFDWYTNEYLPLDHVIYRLRDMDIPTLSGNRTWARATLWQLLKNPAYCGQAGPHTPVIIDQETFSRAGSRLRRNREMASRNAKREYLLRGYLFCKYCGRRYEGAYKRYQTKDGMKEYRYYRCSSITKINDKRCMNQTWKAEIIEALIWQEVETALSNPGVVLTGLEALKEEADEASHCLDELAMIDGRLADLDRQQEQLLHWALKGFPESTVAHENESINRDREGLRQRKAEIEARIQSARQAQVDAESLSQALELVRHNLSDLSFESRRLALAMLSVRITLGEQNIAIEGSIPMSQGSIESVRSRR